ncbi:MAG: glycosyltransferase [Methylococcaceae bacterium]|nr:glycosyltransferase [Methylococcaceae bacterium]
MQEAKVSIVIPCYNYARYVERAIDSVLDQSWADIDLIVINDGSKDDSEQVIRRHHARRGGYRFVTRENRGLIPTLIEGLALAGGIYFSELSADDYLMPDSVERRVRFLQVNPEYVAVFADELIVNGEIVTSVRVIRDKHRRMFARNDPIPAILDGAFPLFPTGLIHRPTLVAAGGFDPDLKHYEDLDVPIRLGLAGKLGFLDEPVMYRREHGHNVSTVTSHIRTEKVIFYYKMLRHPQMLPYRRQVERMLRRSLLALGRSIVRRQQVSERENEWFKLSRSYGWRDLRLLWYRLQVERISKK